MKKFLAVILALATVVSFAACGKDNVKTPGGEKDTVENSSNKEENNTSEKEDVKKIVSEQVQGVWVSTSDDGIDTFYTFKDAEMATYIVNSGKGANAWLSGTFTVVDKKLNFKFSGGTGYANYTYADGKLALTNATDDEIKKQTVADVMAVLTREEQASNPEAVVILADIIAEFFPDSTENTEAATKKTEAKAVIKANGEAAVEKMKIDYDKVEKLAWYLHKNMPTYTDERCYIYPYFGHRDSGETWLLVRVLYTDAQTDDGWIFFDKVVFSVDGENTTKTFSRSEIVRDNDTEVWEYADYEPDVDLLRKIASSEETIIRFQGDEKYYDHTVTDKEKAAITDVLTAYNYINTYKETVEE